MGDMQFDGTQEEWDDLVKKNKSKPMTSIEWLVEELTKQNMYMHLFAKEIEQAKEMHREEIIESYCQGCFDITKDENIFPRETSEQYYNETFKNQQQ